MRQTIKNIEQMLHFKSNRTIQCNCGPIQMFFFLQIRSGWEFGLWQSCAKKTTIDLEAAAASYKFKYKLKIIHYTPHANTVSHWSVEIYNWKYISTPASPLPACWSCDPPPLVFSQLPRAHKPLTNVIASKNIKSRVRNTSVIKMWSSSDFIPLRWVSDFQDVS